MLRRFERPGTPPQWWEVDYRTSQVGLRWGTVGRVVVQSVLRPFATQRQAKDYAEEQIASVLGKGYVEVMPVAAPVVASDLEPRVDPVIAIERTQRFEHEHRAIELLQDGEYLAVTTFDCAIDAACTVLGLSGERGSEPKAVTVDGRRGTRVVWSFRELAIATGAFEVACASARRHEWTAIERGLTAAICDDPELERQCRESPDAPEPWAVYADWLIAHGDPRGEIAQLQLAGKTSEANRVLGAYLALLCGDERKSYALHYRHGFAAGATLVIGEDDDLSSRSRTALADITSGFLAAPMARFVERLRFGLAGSADANDWAPTLRAIVESPRAAAIRELRFDAYTSEDSEISWTPFGDFTGLLEQLPALELLHIRSGAGGTLGALKLPKLRTFIRESGGLQSTEIDAIRKAAWPELRHLEIWFGSPNYGGEGTLSSIRWILDADGLAKLDHLGIVNCAFVDDVIDALASSRILPRLSSLDLSKGTLANRGAAAFERNAPAFRHLASIDLADNLLLDSEVARIRAVLDNVIVQPQREREDSEEDGDESDEGENAQAYRYVAVDE